jgi:hypothetical protein
MAAGYTVKELIEYMGHADLQMVTRHPAGHPHVLLPDRRRTRRALDLRRLADPAEREHAIAGVAHDRYRFSRKGRAHHERPARDIDQVAPERSGCEGIDAVSAGPASGRGASSERSTSPPGRMVSFGLDRRKLALSGLG